MWVPSHQLGLTTCPATPDEDHQERPHPLANTGHDPPPHHLIPAAFQDCERNTWPDCTTSEGYYKDV